MKHIKSSLLVLAVGLCIISCNNSKTEETQNTDSTNMTAPAPDNTMPADTTAPTTDTSMNNSGAGTSGSNTGSSSMNENSSSSNGSVRTSNSNVSTNTATTPMHTMPTTPISRRTVKHVDTRSAVAKTGEYNSDVRTPNPPNLDDRRLKNHPPAHTYGDTANLKTGAVESVR